MTDAGDQLFASYLEIVSPSTAPRVLFQERWQWIIMPPTGRDQRHSIFHRYQVNPNHRAKWLHSRHVDPDWAVQRMDAALNGHPNRVAHPPIVVELTREDMTKYCTPGEERTPWTVIHGAEVMAPRFGFHVK